MDMSTEGNTNGFRSSQSDFVFHSEDANDSFPRTTSNVTEIIELDSSVSDEREMQNGSTTDFRNFGINSNHAQRGLKTYENRQNKNRSGCTLQVSIQIGGTSSRKNSNARKSTDESGLNLVDNQVQCANLHCQSGADLCEAPVFVLTYFGVNRMKNVLQKVCKECFDIALKHQEKLCRLLKNNEPLFSADFPNYKDDVVVMDSVAEIYEEDVLPKSVISLVEDELMGLLKKTVDRFNIDFQINTAQEILFERYENIFASNRKINADLDAIEHCLDATRNLIYKNFKPKYKSLPPLNIVEPGELNLPLPKKKNTLAKKTTLLITPSLTPPIEDTQTTSPPSPPSTSNLESNDIVALKEVEVQAKIPPIGTLFYPLLYVGCPVYAMKTGNLGVWGKARVIEIISRTTDGPNTYRVKFEYSRGLSNKIVTGKQLAFSKPSTIRYPVGTRVIALFHNSDCPAKEAYYAGVIAEPPKILNIFRYLVFFDDGYAQYVPHEKILLVCESSRFVYEDIHPDSREFIRSYLERYPERPMVKLQKGQVIKTEWNGKWWVSRVVAIDGSLAKMHFDADNRTEWIYRGSSRLGPLYSELVAAAARKEQGSLSRHRSLGIASLKKKNMPYVEYSVDQDDPKLPQQAGGSNSKNVAKKSTTPKAFNFENVSDKPQGPPNLNEIMEYTSLGFVRITSLPNRLRGRPFIPHQCGPSCIDWTKFCKEDCKGFNPLTIPLFYGFERQIVKSKTKKDIMYRTPCGMRVRNMLEMHRYLRMTESVMGLDYFDFDLSVNVLHEFHLEPHMYCTFVKDISYGRESTPVSCVNEINHSWPSFMDYSTSRIPQEGVNICLDEEFLVCCSCTDDCQDKAKCECWQLTIEGAKFNCDEDIDVSTIGYQFKRLHEPVATGIFECNQRCKCASTCFNRVAQHPLQLNLQVFRTLKKGWGLRTINDIPKGGFICIYAGRLHTEQSANNDGRMYGDEYLAELDYIEVVERYKEGYESDVIEPGDGKKSGEGGEGDGDEGGDEPDEIDESQLNSDDRDYVPEGLKRLPKVVSIVNTRGRNKKLTTEEKSESEGEKDKEEEGDNDRESMATDDDDEVDMKKKPSKFTVAVPVEEERLKKYKSVREMFGDGTDECYVMDAKSTGNIGRYLNHSCQPNVFVQNVFVDTHDLRFPWVAFFALSHIKAGTELTWDYNYDVGSVPGKVLYCYCNSAECRGRLL